MNRSTKNRIAVFAVTTTTALAISATASSAGDNIPLATTWHPGAVAQPADRWHPDADVAQPADLWHPDADVAQPQDLWHPAD